MMLGVNTFLRRFFPGREFRQHELLVVWAMLICGAGLASSGLMRYLAPVLVAPSYYASESNRWGVWLRCIPDWIVPSKGNYRGIPHPIGFLLPTTYAILTCWFSIFIAWALKSIVLKFGGLRLMRVVLPLFLGLVVGEGIAAAIWVIVGMFTGVGTPVFLPI